MKQQALAYFTGTPWTIAALIIFLVTFIGIVIWVMQKNRKPHYNSMAQMPLKEEKQ